MKTNSLPAVSGLLLISFLNGASAQTTAASSASGPPPAPAPAAPKLLVFHPPAGELNGILPIRIGGGSRGGAADDLSVETLVPDQVALTTQGRPSLYWYQSKAAKTQCEVTVTEPKNPQPLLLLKSSAPTPAGIHAIRLTKFKIELKPNILYRWSIAIVVDPQNRSQDIIANGIIKRINPSPELAEKIGHASDSDKPALYAENGIWYDALQSVSDQIDRAPQDASLRQERVELLKAVGMNGAQMELSKSP
jgi:hypothetical protein